MSPSDFFKTPVIGKIKVKSVPLEWEENGRIVRHFLSSTEYEIICETTLGDRSKVYVTNEWAKEHKREPLVIVEALVESVNIYPQYW